MSIEHCLNNPPWTCRRRVAPLPAFSIPFTMQRVPTPLRSKGWGGGKIAVHAPRIVPNSCTLTQMSLWEDQRARAFWQRRYYDFNIFSERKHIEKLRYRMLLIFLFFRLRCSDQPSGFSFLTSCPQSPQLAVRLTGAKTQTAKLHPVLLATSGLKSLIMSWCISISSWAEKMAARLSSAPIQDEGAPLISA